MKKTHSKPGLRIGVFLLACVLCFVTVFPVQATKVDELESEVSDADKELKSLEKELDNTLDEIERISEELETTKEELAIAKGQEQAQYESMMLRIKYMYENGNNSMVELLFSSSCIAEFLNRAEYIAKISEYDRALLNEYAKNSEEIAAKETELKKSQEYLKDLQDDLDDKIADTSNKLSEYTAKLEKAKEEARKAEEKAKEQIKPIIPDKNTSSGGSSVNTSYGSAVEVTDTDIELLAALLECEAGSKNYEAVLAVASVVVNRMKSRYYPDTVYGVIYQTGQFPPAHDGKVDRVLARGVKPICVQAATDALNGKNNVGNCLSFRAASSGRDGIIIGDNVFF